MKEYNLILLIFIIGFIGCKNDSISKKNKTIDIKTPSIKNDTKNTFSEFTQKDYSLVFQYSVKEKNQLIGINILDRKTIKFHLVTETLPCDTEYCGIAKNKYTNRDGEVDEDEDGGYFVNEYFERS